MKEYRHNIVISYIITTCSANCIMSVFAQLANSPSFMAQSLAYEWSIFSSEGNAVWEWERKSLTIEEGELSAVCMEEAASSELLPTIP